MLRPGGTKITKEAADIMGLPPGSKVLEIGCGKGETLEFLTKEYGWDMTAIDMDLEMVAAAKERVKDADVRYGDGEFLEDFLSKTFDGVVIECVLSLINLPDESLNEIYCVLKNGGKLFISDLYMRDPDPDQVKAIRIEAARQARIPHEYNECSDDCADDHKKRFVNFRFEGRFIKEALLEELENDGFKVLKFEDKTEELKEFIGQAIMDGEPVCQYFEEHKGKKDTGYFMLVAEKE